jgi:hypothetical protein
MNTFSTAAGLLISIGCLACHSSQSITYQERNIPPEQASQPIRSFVQTHYANQHATYSLEEGPEGTFIEVEFNDPKNSTLRFTPAGQLVETEEQIPFETLDTSLQRAIQDHISSNFTSPKIYSTEITTTYKNTTPTERIEIKLKAANGKTGYHQLQFSKLGVLLEATDIPLTAIETLF